ncbi:hypothetical protein F5Y08DRAFT_219446 [Xylaria arbuscula]|nr:hypothetical protein F5Y08DRAFT_219446 [Xylaria arbuscula]
MSAHNTEMTQDDIETVLHQLKKDLIEAVRKAQTPVDQMVHTLPHEANAESSVEIAIKRCVNSALERYTAKSDTISSSQISAPTLPLICSSNTHQSSSDELTMRPSEISSDQSDTSGQLPNTSPEVSISHRNRPLSPLPSTLQSSIKSTSNETPNTCSTASSVENHDDTASRKQARTDQYIWSCHKQTLNRLYMVEKRPLNHVREIMAKEYNFKPTAKQYRYQLGVKWGWKKYNHLPNNSTLGSEGRENPTRPELDESVLEKIRLTIDRWSSSPVGNADSECSESSSYLQDPAISLQFPNKDLGLDLSVKPIEVTGIIPQPVPTRRQDSQASHREDIPLQTVEARQSMAILQPVLDWCFENFPNEGGTFDPMDICNFDISTSDTASDSNETFSSNDRSVLEELPIPEGNRKAQHSRPIPLPPQSYSKGSYACGQPLGTPDRPAHYQYLPPEYLRNQDKNALATTLLAYDDPLPRDSVGGTRDSAIQ